MERKSYALKPIAKLVYRVVMNSFAGKFIMGEFDDLASAEIYCKNLTAQGKPATIKIIKK